MLNLATGMMNGTTGMQLIQEQHEMKVTKLRLPSELGYEKVAMASAATLAAQMGFPPDRIDDIRTVVAEACINAIEHGNELDTSAPITVELGENGTGLEISVTDTGRKVMPSTAPSPGSSPCNRGWGMFLIQNLADEFDYSPTQQGGNKVRVRLNLAHSQTLA